MFGNHFFWVLNWNNVQSPLYIYAKAIQFRLLIRISFRFLWSVCDSERMGVCGSKPKGCVGMKGKLKLQKKRKKQRTRRMKNPYSSNNRNRVEPSNQKDLSYSNPAFQGSIVCPDISFFNRCLFGFLWMFVEILFVILLGLFEELLFFRKLSSCYFCVFASSVISSAAGKWWILEI